MNPDHGILAARELNGQLGLTPNQTAILESASLWDEVAEDYAGDLSVKQIKDQLRTLSRKHIPNASIRNFVLAWFRQLGELIPEVKEEVEAGCRLCQGSSEVREQHVMEVATRYYTTDKLTGAEYAPGMRDIPRTLEAVYRHCKTTFSEDKQIRLWAKMAIAEVEGWPTTPLKYQTAAERADSAERASTRGLRAKIYDGPFEKPMAY